MTKELLTDIAKSAEAFVDNQKSLIIASVNGEGQPLASYAPFYRDADGTFYIFVSTLSAHTANLENGIADILIIEDESASRQIYARNRVNFSCTSRLVEPEKPEHANGLDGLELRHGEILSTLKELADFRLYALQPVTGTFVRGFGQAYTIDAVMASATPIVPQKT